MKYLVTFLVFTLSISMNITSQEIIHLWPSEVPGETKEKAPAVISDNNARNVTRLSEVTDPVMTVYRPEKGKANGAGIVVCPGGGYWILAIDLEGHEIAKWLSELGFTAFVLEYRVPDKKEQALIDAQRALRIVRANADKYELDKAKIGIMGFSAGGSLTARASTLYNSDIYTPVDKMDTVSCKPNFSAVIYPAYLDKGENRSLTPELKVDSLTSPMFLFATADDPHANSALVMSGALRDAKVPVECHILATGGHGYGLRDGNTAAETWPALMEIWLNQFIKQE